MVNEKTDVTRKAADNLSPPAAVSNAPQKKRKETAGEVLFNWGTYGGVTWILNEIISASILDLTKAGDTAKGIKPKPLYNILHGATTWMHKNVNPFKLNYETMHYPLRILVLTSGGNLLIPVVKWLEDRKGKIVRSLDDSIRGEAGKRDKELQAAHDEMDKTPKQSWGSLWQGRAVVMATAVGVDLFTGSEKSPSTKLLQNTWFKAYSNLERVSTSVARDVLRWVHPDPEKRAAISHMRAHTFDTNGAFQKIQPSEGKAAAAIGGSYGFLLAFAGFTSLLFYISSKFFANKRDERSDKKQGNLQDAQAFAANPTVAKSQDREQKRETPSAKVSQVSERSPLDGVQPARAV